MTNEAQRIAIAEACGIQPKRRWRVWWNREEGNGITGLASRDGALAATEFERRNSAERGWEFHAEEPEEYDEWEDAPEYLNDLNAMHEAEKLLDAEQCQCYHDMLSGDEPESHACEADGWWFHATSEKRAEKFLRTLNLWDDSK